MWASSAVDHLGDLDRLLAQVSQLLPAGGWCVVVESEDVPWFLPDEVGLGRPGLEKRCHELLVQYRGERLPDIGADWGSRLTETVLVVQATKTLELELPPPLLPAARRLAQGLFDQLRGAAQNRLAREDVAALDVLLDEADPRGLARR